MIEIRGKVTLSDLARCLYFQTYRRLWPLVLVMVLMELLFLAIVAAALFGNGDHGNIQGMQPMFVVGGFWFLFLAGWPYLSARNQMRDSTLFSEAATYTFSETGILSSRPSASSEMKWTALHSIREIKSSFLLYQTRRVASVVPKRFFENDAQVAAWRELANKSISPKKVIAPGLIGRWF